MRNKEKDDTNVVSGTHIKNIESVTVLCVHMFLSEAIVFHYIFTVKPVIRMEHDSDSDESLITGPIVDGSEGEEDGTQEQSADEESQDTTEGSKKLASGDGPSSSKCKKTPFKVPAKKSRIDMKASTSTSGATPSTSQSQKTTAAETSMVRNRRKGYSTYPAYLYDVPPLQLSIESLWRQFLIAKIEAAKKQSNFYDQAINFMGFTKEIVRSMAEVNGLKFSKPNEEGEHAYAMSQDLFNITQNSNQN